MPMAISTSASQAVAPGTSAWSRVTRRALHEASKGRPFSEPRGELPGGHEVLLHDSERVNAARGSDAGEVAALSERYGIGEDGTAAGG